MEKEILMIAGPNGAGKTTMALELVEGSTKLYEFINADEIAKGLAPLHPESVALAASKLMIGRFRDLLEDGRSFAFETTGAGTNYVKYLEKAKGAGYRVKLVFLWLASAEEAVKRVAQRVKQGGHHVPKETIIRRYHAGLKNLLGCYLPLVNSAKVLDNSSEETVGRLIAKKSKDGRVEVLNEDIWKEIEGISCGR